MQGIEKDYWIKRQASNSWKIWAEFSFESLCLKHLSNIKEALQIGGVSTISGYFSSFKNKKKEVEIDLVIDRADNCINLCEIKFSNKKFVVTKEYAKILIRKKELFRKKNKTKKALFTTLITPFSAIENANYLNSVEKQISLESLF